MYEPAKRGRREGEGERKDEEEGGKGERRKKQETGEKTGKRKSQTYREMHTWIWKSSCAEVLDTARTKVAKLFSFISVYQEHQLPVPLSTRPLGELLLCLDSRGEGCTSCALAAGLIYLVDSHS